MKTIKVWNGTTTGNGKALEMTAREFSRGMGRELSEEDLEALYAGDSLTFTAAVPPGLLDAEGALVTAEVAA